MIKRFLYTGLVVITTITAISCNRKVVPDDVYTGKIKQYDTATFNYIYVEAIKQKVFGNSADALKLLQQSIEVNPESDASYFQMAQILLATGDINSGKKYALKAWSLDQKNFWYLMMLAGTYYKEKNLDSAIVFYEKAVKVFPEKEDLQITLANLYSENQKFDKATRIFESLDEKYGINKTSSSGVVKNLMWAGKWDEALDRASKLIEEFPDEITYNGLLAEIYRGKGEPAKAMEVYQKLIERNPGNAQIQLSLCDFLIEEKKYDDLMSLLNTVILNSDIDRNEKVSLLASIIEKPEIAKAGGNKLVISVMILESEYQSDDLILMIRPEVLIAQDKIDDAIRRLEEIIEARPENYYAWEKLLLAYLQKGDYLNLEKKGEECATRFNRSFMAKALYATAATENKHYEKAIEELRKADILAGNNNEMLLQVLTQRADVYYRMKDYEKAFATFEEALKKNNDDLTLLNNYAYYLAEQDQKLEEAEKMAKKVVEKESTNNTFLDTYAWVLYKRGKYREAERIMQSILASAKDEDAEFYEHYGFILKKRHNCGDAVINWNKAIELDTTKTNLLREIENCRK